MRELDDDLPWQLGHPIYTQISLQPLWIKRKQLYFKERIPH
ncbi:hypothetical protein BLL52_0829 [Rhodoferax antarcticus ANT.BR]|uniref:Uncharacterized protein n=1 Tax=Rhodoferax antarcticus ANT.BR TaxID=1111071 RepID=A0A1Q8YIF3_9BURK|nr:hypothetical protein BLL52_0829 [Rhodoferax antarcticus ANT.BR]